MQYCCTLAKKLQFCTVSTLGVSVDLSTRGVIHKSCGHERGEMDLPNAHITITWTLLWYLLREGHGGTASLLQRNFVKYIVIV